MPGAILFNLLFIVAIVALVVGFILSGRRKKGQQRDDAATVAGRFQTGLAHRFNTPEIRR